MALQTHLLGVIAKRPRVENTTTKLEPFVAEFTGIEDAGELTARALGDLVVGGYIQPGGMGFVEDFAYSVTPRGRQVLARLIPPEDVVRRAA